MNVHVMSTNENLSIAIRCQKHFELNGKDNTSMRTALDEFVTCGIHRISRESTGSMLNRSGGIGRWIFQNLQRRFHLVQNSPGELVGSSQTTHVAGPSLAVKQKC